MAEKSKREQAIAAGTGGAGIGKPDGNRQAGQEQAAVVATGRIALEEVMTAVEAAELWRMGQATVRAACVAGRFRPEECRQSGKVWLVTRAGMKRVYGARAIAFED